MKKYVLLITIMAAAQLVFSQDSTLVATTHIHHPDLPSFKYARIDSAMDFQHFKSDAESNITNNKRIIDQLKEHKTKGDNELRAKYRGEISALEEKNEEMAIKIAVAEMVATPNWPAFKRAYRKEMNELVNTLKTTSDNYLIY